MNYNTKFVGLVSKATIAVAIANWGREPARYCQIDNKPETIRKLMKKLRKAEDLFVCYQAKLLYRTKGSETRKKLEEIMNFANDLLKIAGKREDLLALSEIQLGQRPQKSYFKEESKILNAYYEREKMPYLPAKRKMSG